MSEQLDLESFLPHQNAVFTCPLGPDLAVGLTLVSATEVSRSSHQRQFSVHFTGPRDAFVPQGTYPLSNPGFGTAEIFLVPIGMTAEAYEYEAFFNLLIDSAKGGASE
jgi:hypothetical protein